VATNPEERERVIKGATSQGVLDTGGKPMPQRVESNAELRGIPTARGVAIGPIYRLENPVDLESLEYQPKEFFSEEKSDLMNALSEARREIDEMRGVVGDRFGPEFAAVFYTQMQILEDTGFVQKLEQAIERQHNAYTALTEVLDDYRATFDAIEDPYFRERGADVQEVGRRVMEKLLGVRLHSTPLQPGSIVVVEQILPELFARLEMGKVGALVAEHGGATSHGAIFARTLEIPAVTGVVGILREVRAGETAIVDGGDGRIYLSPDEMMLSEYQRAQEKYAVAVEHLDAMRERPAETRDGRRVVLSANVGLINDLRLVQKHGADGVGLFRTELLALAHRGFPSEEEQEQLYHRLVNHMGSRPVTIRTLDLGGDKGLPNIGLEDEENPQLGCRSIRLSLGNKRAFRAQLRAILRASTRKTVRVLLPMISCVSELRESRAVLDEVRLQLEERGHEFDRDIPMGIMIEVPSAALIADALADECDFFSIGTNDLTQYTLAVDRGNERVAHLYNSLHPAVLTLIDTSVRAAKRAGIPISVCGEMATNPLAVPILVGLGIGELSGTPGSVPVVKEIVRGLDTEAVEEDARRALRAVTPAEVESIAAARIRDCGLLEHPDLGDWLRSVVEEHIGPV
jgi:phosphoenolpyruvate-protein phosphotransferase